MGGRSSLLVVEDESSHVAGRGDGWLVRVQVLEDAVDDLLQAHARLEPGHVEDEQRVLGRGRFPLLDGRDACIYLGRFGKPARPLVPLAAVIEAGLQETVLECL